MTPGQPDTFSNDDLPHDLIARYLLHSTSHLNKGLTIYGAIYLLAHGIAKVVWSPSSCASSAG
jgi:uncharacterized membrane protein